MNEKIIGKNESFIDKIFIDSNKGIMIRHLA
jgi:hypothetical protein